MLPDMLADPLWWMAARLRRILTGLLVLGLAVGAANGPATAAAPSAGGSSADTSLTTVAWEPSDTTIHSGTTVHPDVMVRADATIHPDGGPELSARWAVERPTANVGGLHPCLSLPDPAGVRPASIADERPGAGRDATPYGQRAPPTL